MNIVLVEPEIPPNTGNVARLCAATRTALHLIEPLGFKLDNAQLKRAGMDYWRQVEWRRWKNWQAFADKLPAHARLWFIESNGPSFTPTRNLRRMITWFSGARRRVCPNHCLTKTANAGCGFPCSTKSPVH